MKKFIFSFFVIFSFALTPPKKIHKFFLNHNKKDMMFILDTLYTFTSESKQKTNNYNYKEMMDTYQQIYKDAALYLVNSKNDDLYLGWTPLKKKSRLSHYYKNITKKIDFDTLVQNVPLCYLFCQANITTDSLILKKIFINPIIDLDIDLLLLRDDIFDLSITYNITINMTDLLYYDSGRWFLIFNENI